MSAQRQVSSPSEPRHPVSRHHCAHSMARPRPRAVPPLTVEPRRSAPARRDSSRCASPRSSESPVLTPLSIRRPRPEQAPEQAPARMLATSASHAGQQARCGRRWAVHRAVGDGCSDADVAGSISKRAVLAGLHAAAMGAVLRPPPAPAAEQGGPCGHSSSPCAHSSPAAHPPRACTCRTCRCRSGQRPRRRRRHHQPDGGVPGAARHRVHAAQRPALHHPQAHSRARRQLPHLRQHRRLRRGGGADRCAGRKAAGLACRASAWLSCQPLRQRAAGCAAELQRAPGMAPRVPCRRGSDPPAASPAGHQPAGALALQASRTCWSTWRSRGQRRWAAGTTGARRRCWTRWTRVGGAPPSRCARAHCVLRRESPGPPSAAKQAAWDGRSHGRRRGQGSAPARGPSWRAARGVPGARQGPGEHGAAPSQARQRRWNLIAALAALPCSVLRAA
jgi:hypothetical protein